MSKKIILLPVFVVLLSCWLEISSNMVEVNAPIGYPVHNLDTGLNYTKIQEAIDAPETSDGHTIFVDAGIYYEHIRIKKSILLIGENKSTTIIDGNGTFSEIVQITANDTIMKDFTVKNTDWFGIYVWASTNVTIEDNNVIETFYGIRLDMSSKSRVARNVVENSSFLGILLCDSTNNTLRDNRMANNTESFGVWGISLADFVNDIDETNIVDGKPVCYLVNQYNKQINADAGLVIAVNCTNIIVKNLNVINNDQGIMFAFTNSSRIEANTISQCTSGIDSYHSFNNTIVGNFVLNNSQGISLRWSYDNCFFNNTSTSNGNGIYLYSSDRNIIANNEFSYNYGDYGIDFDESSNNLFYHNNIFKNKENFCSYSSGHNVWDNGHPSGGNYWSDYEGIDANHDGIGDTVYSLIGTNRDRLPLMGMFGSFNTSKGYHVEVVSNSTIEDFEYFESNSTIMMRVSNMTQTQNYGFCRVCIPEALMDVNNITVIIDNGLTPVLNHNYALYYNGTHKWIYFAYEHSTHEIIIVPELSSLLILPLFITSTLLAVIAYRRKRRLEV